LPTTVDTKLIYDPTLSTGTKTASQIANVIKKPTTTKVRGEFLMVASSILMMLY